MLVAPHLQKVPYDSTRDFTFIASYAGISVPCFVRSDSPFQTWDELLDYARKEPLYQLDPGMVAQLGTLKVESTRIEGGKIVVRLARTG